MELVLRVLFRCHKPRLDELSVELPVHECEDEEEQKTYYQKGGAEAYRSDY